MASVYPTATEKLGRTEFVFPYDAAMVEDCKAVPVAYRSYDPDKRLWTISVPYADRILDRFLRRFPHATVDEYTSQERTKASPPPPRPLHADPYEVLHLRPSAPPELVEAAARTLAKLHHPDRQPAHEQARATAAMARINRAAEDLRRRGVA
jgi:DnaJ-domain-containing protein 1